MGSFDRRLRGRDLSALVLRLTIGPMLIIHGNNKVRGPGGLAGTTSYFDGLGLQPAAIHARVAAATEIGSGALVTLGAFNPWATSAVIGLMASAGATDHKGKGFFVFQGGWEYVGVVGAVAAALSALGPGRFSVDRMRGRDRGGLGPLLLSSALGMASALTILTLGRRPRDKAPTGG